MAGKALKYVREQPPAHHIIKIESFSKLSEALKGAKSDHFESREFTAGGYQWVLSIYPNGKKTTEKVDGDGDHISLYLSLVNKLTPVEFIHATIRFFIYNQLEDKYSTIQDVKGKRFDATRSQWGVPQLIDSTTFKNSENGFLVNDCCVLGVEVLVAVEKDKTISCVSKIEDLFDNNNMFAWRIQQFSKLKFSLYKDSVCSPTFNIGGYKWILRMYPAGFDEFKDKFLSLYLSPALPCSALDSGDKLFVKFYILLKDTRYGAHIIKNGSSWFQKPIRASGFADFISLADLNNFNDSMTIEVKFLEMFLLK